MTRIAVVVPVGPEEHHADFLDEALASLREQTRQPDLLVLVDDMHGRGIREHAVEVVPLRMAVSVVSPLWRLGVGGAFNVGVAEAFKGFPLTPCDLAVMLGADDRLEPRVLEHLARVYDDADHAEGYYYFTTVYQSGEEQSLACGNAAFTAGCFRETGGFPSEAGAGGMDAALISAMLVHRPEFLIHVRGNEGRFWNRVHEGQESRRLGRYFGAMDIIRNAYTEAWEPTNWGRYV